MLETALNIIVALGALFSAYILLVNFLLYLKGQRQADEPSPGINTYPMVSILIPVRNEPPVLVKRALESLIRLDWPRDKLEIIIIDDSEPNSFREIKEAVNDFEELNVRLLHRLTPRGRKAGALNDGARLSKGEYLAVLDVDCVVSTNFLRETVGVLEADRECGYVQAKTVVRRRGGLGYLATLSINEYRRGVLLKGLATMKVPQIVGYGFVVRKKALMEAGGWAEWSLTEDVELTVRLSAEGWTGKYTERAVVEYEAPPTLYDLKKQQERWMYGVFQVAVRVLSLPSLGSPLRKMMMLTYLLFFMGLTLNILISTVPIASGLVGLFFKPRALLIVSTALLNIAAIAFTYSLYHLLKEAVGVKEAVYAIAASSVFFNSLSHSALLMFIKNLLGVGHEWRVTPKIGGGRGVPPDTAVVASLMALSLALSLFYSPYVSAWLTGLLASYLFFLASCIRR